MLRLVYEALLFITFHLFGIVYSSEFDLPMTNNTMSVIQTDEQTTFYFTIQMMFIVIKFHLTFKENTKGKFQVANLQKVIA